MIFGKDTIFLNSKLSIFKIFFNNKISFTDCCFGWCMHCRYMAHNVLLLVTGQFINITNKDIFKSRIKSYSGRLRR